MEQEVVYRGCHECTSFLPKPLRSFSQAVGVLVADNVQLSSLSKTFHRLERAAFPKIIKRRACNSCHNLRHLWRVTSAPELPVRLTETFVAMVLKFQFTLCLILLLSFPPRYWSPNHSPVNLLYINLCLGAWFSSF